MESGASREEGELRRDRLWHLSPLGVGVVICDPVMIVQWSRKLSNITVLWNHLEGSFTHRLLGHAPRF